MFRLSFFLKRKKIVFDWIHDSEILWRLSQVWGRFCFLDVLGLVAGCFTLRIVRRRSNALQPNKAIRDTVQPFEMICHGGEGDRTILPIFDFMSQKTESVKLQKIRELYCFGVVQVHAYRSCSVQYEFCLGPNKTYLPGWCMYSHTLGYPTRPSSSH